MLCFAPTFRRLRGISRVTFGCFHWQRKYGMALVLLHFYCEFFTLACAVFGLAGGIFEIRDYHTPVDCVKLSANAAVSLYFNSVQLECVKCEQPSFAQTVSPDGAFRFQSLHYLRLFLPLFRPGLNFGPGQNQGS